MFPTNHGLGGARGARRPGRSRRVVPFAALIILGPFLQACGSGGSNTGAPGAGGAITIALNVDLSGPQQAIGQPQVDGVKAAIADINNSGGVVVGGKTYTLKVDVKDDASDASRVIANAHQIVADGALASVAPDLRFDATYPIWKNKLITIGGGSPSQSVVQGDLSGNPQLIIQIPLLTDYYTGMFTQVNKIFPDIHNVALLNKDDQNGHPESAGLKAAAEAAGLTVVVDDFYPIGTQDLAPYITRLKDKHVDLLVGPVDPGSSIPMVGTAAALGVATHGLTQDLNPADLGDLSAFKKITLIMSHFSVTFDKYNFADIKAAGENLVRLAGHRPIASEIAVDMWNTTHLFALGMQKAGTVTDRSAIVSAMKQVTYNGPFGPVTLSAGQAVVGRTEYHIVKDGMVQTILFDSVGATTPLKQQTVPI